VLFAKVGKKSNAEKDLAALNKLNPKLAGELAEFLKTGKEEDSMLLPRQSRRAC
jgi:hypothetical protein